MRENNTTKEGIKEAKLLAESYYNLFRVKTVKKSTEVATRATYSVITVILFIISLSFFGFALAIYLGSLFESYSLGFLTVGAIPLLSILLMRIFNKQTIGWLLNFFTRLMTRNHD